LNQSGPYDFLLDTGSSRTIVDPSLLVSLNADLATSQMVITVLGVRNCQTRRIRSLSLGSRETGEMEVLSVNFKSAKDLKIKGVLGQDFLSQFDYFLDYPHRRIWFEENGEYQYCLARSPEVFAIQRHAQRMLILAPPQSPGSRSPLLVLDSGASSLILFCQGPEEEGWRTDWSGRKPDFLFNISGRKTVVSGRLREMRLKQLRLEDQRVVFSKTVPAEVGRIEDGLLPTFWFHTLYVNNSRGWVVLNPTF
jgi:hypothetical protein